MNETTSAAATSSAAPRSYTDRKSTRLNSSHGYISYAVFCLKKKKKTPTHSLQSNTCFDIYLSPANVPLCYCVNPSLPSALLLADIHTDPFRVRFHGY